MGKKFTLIELHLDGDTQLGPKTINDALPFGETVESDDVESDDRDDEAAADDDSSGKGALGVLVGLALLVSIGVALKKFRGDEDEDEFEQREEPDVIVN
ncbi:hypothetical protein EL22_20955 [Halostagnicola sp. A56]|uniref:hypothetical protein n=1 Tax=Halostagnicola sp. A56 TaxID=1495067 RepID=UPI0004A15191|nr:hypothetical protein [Halostagnicola sp. A56]KDE60492.1 hypothetical protein EL22_20955 [Halostagnicola sp. A56]